VDDDRPTWEPPENDTIPTLSVSADEPATIPTAPPVVTSSPSRSWVWAALVGALVGALVAGVLVAAFGRKTTRTVTNFGNNSSKLVTSDVQSVLSKVEPGVVNVRTQGFSQNEFFQPEPQQGAGTGMVITPDGDVLTNAHVIAGATNIKVTLTTDNKTYDAVVLGSDPTADVAVIRMQGVSNLKTVTLGKSSSMVVGGGRHLSAWQPGRRRR
jgi:S1-C subfamily serine protease